MNCLTRKYIKDVSSLTRIHTRQVRRSLSLYLSTWFRAARSASPGTQDHNVCIVLGRNGKLHAIRGLSLRTACALVAWRVATEYSTSLRHFGAVIKSLCARRRRRSVVSSWGAYVRHCFVLARAEGMLCVKRSSMLMRSVLARMLLAWLRKRKTIFLLLIMGIRNGRWALYYSFNFWIERVRVYGRISRLAFIQMERESQNICNVTFDQWRLAVSTSIHFAASAVRAGLIYKRQIYQETTKIFQAWTKSARKSAILENLCLRMQAKRHRRMLFFWFRRFKEISAILQRHALASMRLVCKQTQLGMEHAWCEWQQGVLEATQTRQDLERRILIDMRSRRQRSAECASAFDLWADIFAYRRSMGRVSGVFLVAMRG